MFILGITGGIGSGKSTVSGILEERGLPVIDADEISRKVTAEGGRAVDAIREEFGEKAVDSSGAMNRKVVSDIVFNDRMKLDKLSGIVHKYVFEEISDELDILNQKGTKCVVLDVPIPVNKFIDMCNQIWVVTCETNVRIRRLKERGLEESDAIRRIGMQMSDEEYQSLGDFTLDNSGSIDSLKEQMETLIQEQLVERGIRI